MYEFSKDNIDGYVCGLHLYIYMWIFKVGKLSTMIFGKLHVCIYIYIYIDVNFKNWQVEYIDIWQVACIYMCRDTFLKPKPKM